MGSVAGLCTRNCGCDIGLQSGTFSSELALGALAFVLVQGLSLKLFPDVAALPPPLFLGGHAEEAGS